VPKIHWLWSSWLKHTGVICIMLLTGAQKHRKMHKQIAAPTGSCYHGVDILEVCILCGLHGQYKCFHQSTSWYSILWHYSSTPCGSWTALFYWPIYICTYSEHTTHYTLSAYHNSLWPVAPHTQLVLRSRVNTQYTIIYGNIHILLVQRYGIIKISVYFKLEHA